MDPVSDFQLLSETTADNRAPFREFYRRHAADVYDFAWRVLKDPGAAEAALRETFEEALESAPMVVRPADVRTWLYGIAYRSVMLRLEAGAQPPDEPPPSPPALVAEGADIEVDPETAALVWEAASGLDEHHYALLDLDLRREFDAGEIAIITGENRAQTMGLISRLERVVESAILAYVVARQGVAFCDQLRVLLGDARIPPFPPDLRALVDRHIDACDTCHAMRQRAPSPLEVLAALAPVTPDQHTLERTLAAALGQAAPGPEAEEEPEPEAEAQVQLEPEDAARSHEAGREAAPAAEAAPPLVPALAPEVDGGVFPGEGLDAEPEALVLRATTVEVAAPEPEVAAQAEPAAEEAAEPVVASATPEARETQGPEAAPAPEPAEAPPVGGLPPWRKWLQRPWASFGLGVAGGLVIIASVMAFVFASGNGDGALGTTPTETLTPAEAPPVAPPPATETPAPTPTATPEPEPTEEPGPPAEPQPTEEPGPPTEPPEEAPTLTPAPTEPPALSPTAPATPLATATAEGAGTPQPTATP